MKGPIDTSEPVSLTAPIFDCPALPGESAADQLRRQRESDVRLPLLFVCTYRHGWAGTEPCRAELNPSFT